VENKKGLIPIAKQKNAFATHRASIESYFIDAHLLHKYFVWLRNTPNYKTKKDIYIPTIDEIQTTILNAAKKMQDYQATRWALSKLKANNKFFFETKWEKEDGKMPKDFSLIYCKSEANKLIASFANKARKINTTNFEKYLAEFTQKFSETDFYTQEKHLAWFHGKDLKAIVRNELLTNYKDLYKLNFNIDVYMEHICTVFNEHAFF
jgi:hypothetical protein